MITSVKAVHIKKSIIRKFLFTLINLGNFAFPLLLNRPNNRWKSITIKKDTAKLYRKNNCFDSIRSSGETFKKVKIKKEEKVSETTVRINQVKLKMRVFVKVLEKKYQYATQK